MIQHIPRRTQAWFILGRDFKSTCDIVAAAEYVSQVFLRYMQARIEALQIDVLRLRRTQKQKNCLVAAFATFVTCVSSHKKKFYSPMYLLKQMYLLREIDYECNYSRTEYSISYRIWMELEYLLIQTTRQNRRFWAQLNMQIFWAHSHGLDPYRHACAYQLPHFSANLRDAEPAQSLCVQSLPCNRALNLVGHVHQSAQVL